MVKCRCARIPHPVLMKILSLFATFCLLAGLPQADQAARERAIAENLREYGAICLTGDPCDATPVRMAANGADQNRSGEKIYQTFCTSCHATGIAGAPLVGNPAAWQPLRARGLSLLLKTVVTGKGAMPPKGLCMDCSESELRATVQYMLNTSR